MNSQECFLRPLQATHERSSWMQIVIETVCSENSEASDTIAGVLNDMNIYCKDSNSLETIRSALAQRSISVEEIERPDRERASKKMLFFLSQALAK